jgi:hypothetical protein
MPSKKLLEGVASILADYRKGEIELPDAAHVNRWIMQFDQEVHDPILKETQYVLERTYVTRREVNKFLKGLSSHAELTNGKPEKFWKETSVLKIQQNGSSQKEMLQILGEIIKNEYKVDIDESSQDGDEAVYIDDLVFGGGHVRGDLGEWITNSAPKEVTHQHHRPRLPFGWAVVCRSKDSGDGQERWQESQSALVAYPRNRG